MDEAWCEGWDYVNVTLVSNDNETDMKLWMKVGMKVCVRVGIMSMLHCSVMITETEIGLGLRWMDVMNIFVDTFQIDRLTLDITKPNNT